MRLAVPMQVLEIQGHNALCTANGVERRVNLLLLQDHAVNVGDFAMMHIGYAIQKIDLQQARPARETHDRLRAIEISHVCACYLPGIA